MANFNRPASHCRRERLRHCCCGAASLEAKTWALTLSDAFRSGNNFRNRLIKCPQKIDWTSGGTSKKWISRSFLRIGPSFQVRFRGHAHVDKVLFDEAIGSGIIHLRFGESLGLEITTETTGASNIRDCSATAFALYRWISWHSHCDQHPTGWNFLPGLFSRVTWPRPETTEPKHWHIAGRVAGRVALRVAGCPGRPKVRPTQCYCPRSKPHRRSNGNVGLSNAIWLDALRTC